MMLDLSKWTISILSDVNYFTLSIILGILILIFYYCKSNSVSSKLTSLPGPRGFPVVGYFPFLGSMPYLSIHKLSKKYGPIFKVQLGSVSCLFLCNFEVVHEAFVKQYRIYSDRPKNLPFKVFANESAFIFDDGASFKDIKMFSVDTLKKLGFGKLSLEVDVKLEVQDLINEIVKFNEQPIDVSEITTKSVGNTICTLLCGKRSKYDDPWLNSLIEAINNFLKCATYSYLYFFPWLKNIPFWENITNYKKKVYWKNKIWRIWQEKIDDIKKDIAEGKVRECYISAWFKEQEKRNSSDDSLKDFYSEFNLRSNLDILGLASFETTTTTIIWCLQYLIKRPDVQKKIKEEIDSQLNGKEFDLSFIEVKKFPYLRAVIQETHRLSSIIPFGVMHWTNDKSNLLGYDIPKGITIIPSIYSVHHDPENFPDPEEFKPERFLTHDGQFIRCEKVIPFSIGKRLCPGEFVAQMEIFHYLTAIIYKFELKLGPNNDNLGENKGPTTINFPLNFSTIFKPWKN